MRFGNGASRFGPMRRRYAVNAPHDRRSMGEARRESNGRDDIEQGSGGGARAGAIETRVTGGVQESTMGTSDGRRKLMIWRSFPLALLAGCLILGFATLNHSDVVERILQSTKARNQPAITRKGRLITSHLLPDGGSSDQESDHLTNVVDGCDGSKRQVDEIQLHVIGWRRPEALESLLNSLEKSSYSGWDLPVPLHIHVDGGSKEEVIFIANDFEWTHGRKILDIRDENVGLREMWFSSLGSVAKAAGDNTLMIVFEDDMAVSPDYFQWILATVDKYGRNIHCRDANLMGFSLSPIRVEEMTKPFTRWNATLEVGSNRTAFLSVLPSSWGAAYWSDRWTQFADFAQIRMKSQYYDMQSESLPANDYGELRLTPEELFIPNARSNVWPKSWKRFMIDWMYARGLVMLYPCLPGERGLASTMALPGEHINSGSPRHRNPRISQLAVGIDRKVLGRTLPDYKDLAVRGLHLQPTTREKLASSGAKFLRDVKSHCDYCNELLRAWARPWTCLEDGDDDSVKNSCDGLMKGDDEHFENNQPSRLVNPICAPDLYMPASFKMKATSQERYLLFEPQYGGNNQLIAILQARDFAKVLGRTLVVPPIFLPRVGEFSRGDMGDWPDTEKVLTVLDTYIPGHYSQSVSFKEWLERNATLSRIVSIGRDAVYDNSSRILTDVILQTGPKTLQSQIPTINMRQLVSDKAVSVNYIKHLFGGCKDEVLAFDQMYFVNLNVGGKIGGNRNKKMEKWASTVELSPVALGILNVIKAKLEVHFGQSEYACYHVRLEDFLPMCKSLQDHGGSPYYDKLLKDGYKCFVTPEEAKKTMLSIGMPALVMTNDATAVEVTLDEGFVSSVWVKQIIADAVPRGTNEAEQELLSLILEQELCADADAAFLNMFSTVSIRVASLRRASGKTYSYWKEVGVPTR